MQEGRILLVLSALVVVACLLPILAMAQGGGLNECQSASACQPWVGSKQCVKGGAMDLRFMIRNWSTNASNPASWAMYSFCPKVDKQAAFQLVNVGPFVADAFTPTTANLSATYITVFGEGAAEDGFVLPNVSGAYGRAMFAHLPLPADTVGFGCPVGQVYIASFMMLNLTFTNGGYVYNVNSTSGKHTGDPVNSGFVSTCGSDNKCLFGDPGCIGTPGQMNCAKCYSPEAIPSNITTSIWVTYYGKDVNGRSMTSGQYNPLNFLQYAQQSGYTSVTSAL